jgi:hypothetical protein
MTSDELDAEGIPDLEGPLPEKEATGDPQEGLAPPSDRPASFDYGVTEAEQRAGEPISVRVAREEPDVVPPDDASPVLVGPDDEALGLVDEEKDMTARGVDAGGGLSAEEAAVHVTDEDELG